MVGRLRIVAAVVAALFVIGAALGAAPGATAKPKKISGKLDANGYTVIALATSGAARADEAPNGKFSLRPPADTVTLHLRAPDGRYAGPIVLGKREGGDRAVVGVNAGADLGAIDVLASKGYAKVKGPPKGAIDEERLAKAKNGVPRGAGNLGLVKSKPPKDAPKGDRDFDGVPDPLDIDDDGDLVLDAADGSSGASAFSAKAGGSTGFSVNTALPGGGPGRGVNVNGGSTDEQIAANFQERGLLQIAYSGIDPGSGELDCGGAEDPANPNGWIGGLSYCTRGGTGRVSPNYFVARADAPAFPGLPQGQYDPDGDGFGALSPYDPGHGEPSDGTHGWTFLFHGATTDQIDAGDVLIERATVDGTPSESVATVGLVLSTITVFASYDDGQGNSTQLSYRPDQTGPPLGTPENPPPVKVGPGGDLVIRLALWRHQRPRIEGESGSSPWMDVGHIAFTPMATVEGQTASNFGKCPQNTLSTDDPELVPYTGPPTGPPIGTGFVDLANDQPSDPSNTLTYTVNVTRCLAANGLSAGPGDKINLTYFAYSTNPNGSMASTTSGIEVLLQG